MRGAVDVNGQAARAGDGVAIADEPALSIMARTDGSEFLVFDLP